MHRLKLHHHKGHNGIQSITFGFHVYKRSSKQVSNNNNELHHFPTHKTQEQDKSSEILEMGNWVQVWDQRLVLLALITAEAPLTVRFRKCEEETPTDCLMVEISTCPSGRQTLCARVAEKSMWLDQVGGQKKGCNDRYHVWGG